MASIEFNGVPLARELDVFAQVQLPFLAAVTVNRVAAVVRKDLQREIYDSFDFVSKFTADSPKQRHFATKTEPYTEVYLRDEATKGQSPAQYLLPQIKGGLPLETRFQRRLKAELDGYNGRWMVPIPSSPGAKLNEIGKIKASQYVEALFGIKAMESLRASTKPGKYRTEGSYVYVPFVGANKELAKQMRALGKGRIPKPGIYRMSGDDIVPIFKQLERIPTVQKRFDFQFAAKDSLNKNINIIFEKVLNEFVK